VGIFVVLFLLMDFESRAYHFSKNPNGIYIEWQNGTLRDCIGSVGNVDDLAEIVDSFDPRLGILVFSILNINSDSEAEYLKGYEAWLYLMTDMAYQQLKINFKSDDNDIEKVKDSKEVAA
jgi:hypothetical protein